MIALLALAGAAFASGTIVFDGSIGTGKPPRRLQGRTMLRFGRDTRTRGLNVTTVRGPTGTITFSHAVTHFIVKNVSTEWRTWSNGYHGSVYASVTKVKIILPRGTTAFYLYAEPNSLQAGKSPTVIVRSGSASSGRVKVSGKGGAKFFGFIAKGGATLTSVTVRSSDSAFAVGEFGIHKR